MVVVVVCGCGCFQIIQFYLYILYSVPTIHNGASSLYTIGQLNKKDQRKKKVEQSLVNKMIIINKRIFDIEKHYYNFLFLLLLLLLLLNVNIGFDSIILRK